MSYSIFLRCFYVQHEVHSFSVLSKNELLNTPEMTSTFSRWWALWTLKLVLLWATLPRIFTSMSPWEPLSCPLGWTSRTGDVRSQRIHVFHVPGWHQFFANSWINLNFYRLWLIAHLIHVEMPFIRLRKFTFIPTCWEVLLLVGFEFNELSFLQLMNEHIVSPVGIQ